MVGGSWMFLALLSLSLDHMMLGLCSDHRRWSGGIYSLCFVSPHQLLSPAAWSLSATPTRGSTKPWTVEATTGSATEQGLDLIHENL